MIKSPLFTEIRNYLIRAKQEDQIFIFVPYIKTKILEELLEGIENKITVITTWHINDLIRGSSELELYDFCKKRGIYLYINQDIHLKVYSVNLNTGIIASGNISDRGLMKEDRFEAGIISGKFSIEDRSYLQNIKNKAEFVNEQVFQKYLKRYEECKEKAHPINDFKDPPSIPKKEDFLISALPMTKNIDELIKGYIKMNSQKVPSDNQEIMDCIYHDLTNYNIEQGLSKEEFIAKLKVEFFAHPFTQKIDEFIDPEAYFGRVKEWIQNNCTNVPIPSRRELTGNVQVLYEWFVKLGDGKYAMDTPNHSQRLYKVAETEDEVSNSEKNILEYENEVLQILNEPGYTIEQVREEYKKLPTKYSLHDEPSDPDEQANEFREVWHYKNEVDVEIENRFSLTEDEVGERNSRGRLYKKIVNVIMSLHEEKLIKFWFYKKHLIRGSSSDGVWRLTEKGKQEIQKRKIINKKEATNSQNPILKFEVGKFYHHDDIWKPLDLGWSGGIRTSVKNKLVILFWNAPSEDIQKEKSDDYGRVNIYEDSFDEKTGLYRYIGEGKEGNQTLTRGNKAIVDAKQNRRTIHLFHQHEKNGKHEYLGEMELVGEPETQVHQDINEKDRDEFVFFLKPLEIQKINRNDIQSESKNSRLVLFSVAGEAAFEHYEDTILKDVNTSNFESSDMKKFANVRMWGAIDRQANQNRSKWSKLHKGDTILFYRDKKYIAKMILDGTEDNSKIAKMIWGEKIDHEVMNVKQSSGETWQLIMYCSPEKIEEIDLKFEELNKLLGYKENFMPTRTLDFTTVSENRLQELQNKYGSVNNALNSIM